MKKIKNTVLINLPSFCICLKRIFLPFYISLLWQFLHDCQEPCLIILKNTLPIFQPWYQFLVAFQDRNVTISHHHHTQTEFFRNTPFQLLINRKAPALRRERKKRDIRQGLENCLAWVYHEIIRLQEVSNCNCFWRHGLGDCWWIFWVYTLIF